MTIAKIVERELEKALSDRGPDRAKIFNSAVSIKRAARAACLAVATAVVDVAKNIVASEVGNPTEQFRIERKLDALSPPRDPGKAGK